MRHNIRRGAVAAALGIAALLTIGPAPASADPGPTTTSTDEELTDMVMDALWPDSAPATTTAPPTPAPQE